MDDFVENAEPRVIAMMLMAIVFMVLTIQVLYLLWPQIKTYRQLQPGYTVLQQAADNSMDLQLQLKTTTDEIDKLSYQLHGDMAGLPEKQMESYIIGRLQKVSWRSGVELASVIPGRGRMVQMFQETLFDIKINATYFNFVNWLQTINNELGYIVVKKFEIRPITGKAASDPVLNISLTLVSYRLQRDV